MPRVADNSPEFNPQSDWPSSSRHETRRGWANCFPLCNPRSEHPPDLTGVTVIGGRKHWVNVYIKRDRDGQGFASVNIKPWEKER
jgi:hypothetical protein